MNIFVRDSKFVKELQFRKKHQIGKKASDIDITSVDKAAWKTLQRKLL